MHVVTRLVRSRSALSLVWLSVADLFLHLPPPPCLISFLCRFHQSPVSYLPLCSMNDPLPPSAPIRRLLGRLEPSDLQWALGLPKNAHRPTEWKALLRGPRRALLHHILTKTCPNGITHRQLARADIVSRERRDGGGMQQWKALKILPSSVSSPAVLSPELVQTRLADALSPLFLHVS